MRMWWWRRGKDEAHDASRAAPNAAELRDERLSLYLDGDLQAGEAAAVEREVAADAGTRAALEGMRSVTEALRALGAGELGETRAPRPFTLTAPAAAPRARMGGGELVTRLGALAAAVAFVAVVSGDALLGGGSGGSDGAGTSSAASAGVSVAESMVTESQATGAAEARTADLAGGRDDSAAAPTDADAARAPDASVPALAPPSPATPTGGGAPAPDDGAASTLPNAGGALLETAPAGEAGMPGERATGPQAVPLSRDVGGDGGGIDALLAIEIALAAAALGLGALAALRWAAQRRA